MHSAEAEVLASGPDSATDLARYHFSNADQILFPLNNGVFRSLLTGCQDAQIKRSRN